MVSANNSNGKNGKGDFSLTIFRPALQLTERLKQATQSAKCQGTGKMSLL